MNLIREGVGSSLNDDQFDNKKGKSISYYSNDFLQWVEKEEFVGWSHRPQRHSPKSYQGKYFSPPRHIISKERRFRERRSLYRRPSPRKEINSRTLRRRETSNYQGTDNYRGRHQDKRNSKRRDSYRRKSRSRSPRNQISRISRNDTQINNFSNRLSASQVNHQNRPRKVVYFSPRPGFDNRHVIGFILCKICSSYYPDNDQDTWSHLAQHQERVFRVTVPTTAAFLSVDQALLHLLRLG